MRKWRKLSPDQLIEWDKIKHSIMKSISEAKYAQSIIGKNVLILTQNAELLHFLPRKSYKLHFQHLEDIRDKIYLGMI